MNIRILSNTMFSLSSLRSPLLPFTPVYSRLPIPLSSFFSKSSFIGTSNRHWHRFDANFARMEKTSLRDNTRNAILAIITAYIQFSRNFIVLLAEFFVREIIARVDRCYTRLLGNIFWLTLLSGLVSLSRHAIQRQRQEQEEKWCEKRTREAKELIFGRRISKMKKRRKVVKNRIEKQNKERAMKCFVRVTR